MKTYQIKILFTFLFLLNTLITKSQITIVSGVEGGSYYQFANDIKKIADSVMKVSIRTSSGSVDNFNQLIAKKEMNISFLQEDVLVNQQLKDLEKGTDNIEKIRVVLPLGTEEIHLVVRNDGDIENIEDLDGKKVVVGTENQGTYITANLIKEMTGVQWKNVSLPFEKVIEALKNKEIDAFFFVGATPVKAFVNMPPDMPFKLLPIVKDRLEEIYTRTKIKEGTYPWVTEDVPTFSLRFVLATNISEETKEKRILMRKLLTEVKNKYSILKEMGHLKWRDINFEKDIKNLDWRVYDISEEVFTPLPPIGSHITLYSGLENGSYDQFANDIQKICNPADSLKTKTSNGSVDNLNQLMLRQNIFVTFLQYDVLLQQRLRDKKDGTHYADSIRILLPLGDEEIHLITRANSDIKSLKDLKDKKVGIGTVYQGTYVTARLIKGLTKINWLDVPIPFEQVYISLMTNQIDAFFFVGSAPVSKLFYLTSEQKLKLVPIRHEKLDGVYTSKKIKAATYPWQKNEVETYAVRSVIATNIANESPEQRKSIQNMLAAIKAKKTVLEKNGHKKWSEVNFNFSQIEWEKYKGTEEILSGKVSTDALDNLNYKDNSAKKFDFVAADTIRNNHWFYLRLLTDKNKKDYTIVGNGSKLSAGSAKNFEEGLLWGFARKQIAIGPFFNSDEALNARMMYNRTKPRLPESVKNAKNELYWFYVSIVESQDSLNYQLKEMPSKIETGSNEEFLDDLYKSLNYGLLIMGPYWDKKEAERAQKIYRKHE